VVETAQPRNVVQLKEVNRAGHMQLMARTIYGFNHAWIESIALYIVSTKQSKQAIQTN
jgi:hypothetical protein